eukprot:g2712.t1
MMSKKNDKVDNSLDPPGYNEDEDSDFEPDAVELAESGGIGNVSKDEGAFKTKAPTKSSTDRTDALWKSMHLESSSSSKKKSTKSFSLAQLQKKSKKKRKRQNQWKDMFKTSKRAASSSAQALAAAKKAVAKKGPVMSVVNFAGKKMTLIESSSGAISTSSGKGVADPVADSNAKKVTSVDSILEAIKDPKKITTVEKSSYDWDKYKAEKGLDETFEKSAQNGYVDRQKFLNRVDWRRFESERKVREAERAKALAAKGKKK